MVHESFCLSSNELYPLFKKSIEKLQIKPVFKEDRLCFGGTEDRQDPKSYQVKKLDGLYFYLTSNKFCLSF